MERISFADEPTLKEPSYLRSFLAWAFLALLSVASWYSVRALVLHPVTVAVFKGGEAAQVYRVSLFLDGREPKVEEAGLTPAQRHEVSRSILTGDDETLRQLSRVVGAEGRYAAAAGDAGTALDWPPFFGGGFPALRQCVSSTWSSGLTLPERIILDLWSKTPPAAPWNPASDRPAASAASGTAPGAETAKGDAVTTAAASPLRVEILNGCGITNAADAFARAARDAGLEVIFVGNADNFRHAKTTVESRSGMPVALEELLGRLGIPVAEVRQTTSAKAGVDVTLTVGRDYTRIRERLRGRNQR